MTTAELTAALTALSPTTLAAIIAELEARLTANTPDQNRVWAAANKALKAREESTA